MQENSQTFYHKLPNGIQIVHRRTPSPVAYVGVMVGAGTRDEAAEENGMAHYIEHCVFKGTAHRTARQLIRSIEGIGGEINAYTTKEETTFYAAITTEHVRLTMHLLAELVSEPAFRKEETDKERMVIQDEIDSYNDQPSELIYDDFEGLVFAHTPLAQPILGTRKTLRHISSKPEYARRWMETHYRPERMVVFCQGDVAPEVFFRIAEKEFGGTHWTGSNLDNVSFQSGNSQVIVRECSRDALDNTSLKSCKCFDNVSIMSRECLDNVSFTPKEAHYRRHTHQVHAMLGGKAYALGHEKQLATYLLNNLLGGGSLNSRLNLSLREAKGLVYTVESTYTPLSDTGYWCVYWACEPEHYEESLRLVKAELERLCTQPLSEAALRNAMHQLRGQMAIAAQNQENSALSMAKSMLYFGHAPEWQETYAKIAKTSAKELQEIAKALFEAENRYILTYE